VSALRVRGIVPRSMAKQIVKNYGQLIRYSHMISCRSVAQVRRWSDAGELAKVADEVRLIEIAGRSRKVRPIELFGRVDPLQDAPEAREPGKYLRTQAHLPLKHLDEALGGDAELIPDASDRRYGAGILKLSNRMLDAATAWAARTESFYEKGLEHEKSFAVRRRCEETFVQFAGLARPEGGERNLKILQLTCWTRSKRKAAARLEHRRHHPPWLQGPKNQWLRSGPADQDRVRAHDVQVDDESQAARGQHELARMRLNIAFGQPQIADVCRQRLALHAVHACHAAENNTWGSFWL
jgi:hypothetical protein